MEVHKESLLIHLKEGNIRCSIGFVRYVLTVGIESDVGSNRFVFCRISGNWNISNEEIQKIADETNLPVKVSENLVLYPKDTEKKDFVLDYAEVFDIARNKESLNEFMDLALPARNEYREKIKDILLGYVHRLKQIDDALVSRIVSFLETSEANSKTLDLMDAIKAKFDGSPKAKEFLLNKLVPFLENSEIRENVASMVKRLVTEAYNKMRRGNVFPLKIQRIDDDEIRVWERQEFARLEARLDIKWQRITRDWHCWNCHSVKDEDLEEAAVCNRCRWYVCNKCGKCAEDCNEDE